jgi:hypothetical protein
MEAVTQLAGGIDTDQTGAGVTAFRLPERPYPGLRPFKVSEWPIFFGREVMAQEVVDRLVAKRMVVIHGASGCGKSSLIFAGVLPQLGRQARRRRQDLAFAEMRPGHAPLRTLAEALARGCGIADVAAVQRVVSHGRAAAAPLEALLAEHGVARVCLYVDQFEELFRFAQDVSAEEAALFVEVLMSVAGIAREDTQWWETPPLGFDSAPGAPRVRLMLSMRSEFLGDCARFPGFAEVVNQTQYLLPDMTAADLLRSILEPAEPFDGGVERALAERLAEEAALEKDPLPLVQHALMRLWKSGTTLTLAQYEAAAGPGPGGLGRLLAAHADEVLARHGGPDDPASEQLFRALTDLDPAGRAIRRPLQLDRLLALVDAPERPRLRAIIDDFRAEDVAFIRPNAEERASPLAGDQMIDISHEALLRTWPRIADATLDPETGNPRGWLHREFEDGLIWRSLAVQARAFRADPGACLDPATTGKRSAWYATTGSRAAWANRHLIVRTGDVPEAEPEWRDVDALMIASERERRQARRRRLIGLGILATTVAVALGALGYAVVMQRHYEQMLKARDAVLTRELTADAQAQRTRAQVAETPAAPTTQAASDVYVWLGPDGDPNVHAAQGTARAVPSTLKPGDRVRMITETVARAGLPQAETYHLANGIGYLAKDAAIEIVAPPVSYQRGPTRQYWARARAEVISLGTVYVQFSGGAAAQTALLERSRNRANAIVAGLKRYGLTVPGAERVTMPAGMSEVRYFHPEDRDRARLLASVVVQVANANRFTVRAPAQKDLSRAPRKSPQGVVELWVDLAPTANLPKGDLR